MRARERAARGNGSTAEIASTAAAATAAAATAPPPVGPVGSSSTVDTVLYITKYTKITQKIGQVEDQNWPKLGHGELLGLSRWSSRTQRV